MKGKNASVPNNRFGMGTLQLYATQSVQSSNSAHTLKKIKKKILHH